MYQDLLLILSTSIDLKIRLKKQHYIYTLHCQHIYLLYNCQWRYRCMLRLQNLAINILQEESLEQPLNWSNTKFHLQNLMSKYNFHFHQEYNLMHTYTLELMCFMYLEFQSQFSNLQASIMYHMLPNNLNCKDQARLRHLSYSKGNIQDYLNRLPILQYSSNCKLIH